MVRREDWFYERWQTSKIKTTKLQFMLGVPSDGAQFFSFIVHKLWQNKLRQRFIGQWDKNNKNAIGFCAPSSPQKLKKYNKGVWRAS